ncbi:MAG: cobalt-precorrin-6A reductase [Proteobacteria bacterium]|nr:cobalt-precorrin-6A reductase [Pseudomonadota bacterium]
MEPRSSLPLRTLILGGTTEAANLARALAHDARALAHEPTIAATLSLAGRTTAPILPPIPHRIGGFGGIAGLVAYLRTTETAAIIDATHPFAAQISDHACQAAALTATPILRIDRPAWRAEPGDQWTHVTTMTQAAQALGPTPRRVFLTIGQQDLAPFRAAPWHDYIIRSVDPPAAALCPPNAELITARGPFTVAGETALLQTHRIDIIVTKNAGAAATSAKLTAARTLGIPIIMIARPSLPPCPTVPDADGALDWLKRQVITAR